MALKGNNLSAFIIALLASLGYGGWAIYANHEYEPHVWMMAGMVQAIYAFASTYSITYVAQYIFIKYNCGIKGVIAGFGMSFLVMLAIPIAVHSLVGTPDLLQTILPGLIWGSIYLLGFLMSLYKAQNKEFKL